MEIRKITEEEKNLTVELRRYSFGKWIDDEITDIEIADTIPDNTYGVFDKKKLMSMIRIYEIKQNMRGTMKDSAGIASIGTYPQARHRGYVKALMKKCFEFMRDKEIGLSILMAFKESFYEKFGYVKANSKLMVKVPLTTLSQYIDIIKDNQWTYKLYKAKDGKSIYQDFVKDIAPDIHGYCTFEKISDGEWMKANHDTMIVTVSRQDKIMAIAKYRKQGFVDRGEIIVNDMFWKNLTARDKLFNFFARHTDQIAYITLPVPFGVDIHGWIKDSMENLKTEIPRDSWMVRVCDFAKAVSGIRCSVSDMDINILIKDPYCEWNNGLFNLTCDGNMLNAHRIDKGSADVQADVKGVSAMTYGTLPFTEIEHRRWINITNPIVKPILIEVFPQKPIYMSHDFRSTYL
jgi:predicted acetyltransferase